MKPTIEKRMRGERENNYVNKAENKALDTERKCWRKRKPLEALLHHMHVDLPVKWNGRVLPFGVIGSNDDSGNGDSNGNGNGSGSGSGNDGASRL